MAADGYTTTHELSGRDPGFIEAAAELASRGELAVRMNVYLTYNRNSGEVVPDNWNSYPYTARVDTMVRVVGVKTFAMAAVVGKPLVSRLNGGRGQLPELLATATFPKPNGILSLL